VDSLEASDSIDTPTVRSAVDARNAAQAFWRFGVGLKSWGVWGLVLGAGFVTSDIVLRTLNPGAMGAPQFIGIIAFACVLLLVGAYIYKVEHESQRSVYGDIFENKTASDRQQELVDVAFSEGFNNGYEKGYQAIHREREDLTDQVEELKRLMRESGNGSKLV